MFIFVCSLVGVAQSICKADIELYVSRAIERPSE